MSRKNPPAFSSSYHQVKFLPGGAPYSTQFDDIFFDSEHGCTQSEQVFILGNNLSERWNLWHNETFVIAETGFGTGLNFILMLAAFDNWLNKNQLSSSKFKIHFISVEKYPLSKSEIQQALAMFPEYEQYSQLLLNQYPEDLSGNHILPISEYVSLSLHFDDATNALSQINSTEGGLVDAWFLDGFSPRKNPDMWQDSLYLQIARLSKIDASLATFTVAGNVRRGLANVGFRLEKKSCDGQKKQILVAKYQPNTFDRHGYKVRPTIAKPQQIYIVGGGIAAACLAWSLTKRGIRVIVLCKDDALAQGASSNAIGALYPLLHQELDDISEFFSNAFFYAKKTYQSLLDSGFHFEHQWCGVVEVAFKDAIKKRQTTFNSIAQWPQNLVKQIDAKTLTELANINLPYSGLLFPEAGWVNPPMLVNQLFTAASATGLCKIKLNHKVEKIIQLNSTNWEIFTKNKHFETAHVVICSGAESTTIELPEQVPIYPVRGQVTSMSANSQLTKLSTVLCHKGYLTPSNHNIQCIGATFEKNNTNQTENDDDNNYNLTMLNRCLPNISSWQTEDIVSAKARLRACTADHLPIIGNVAIAKRHYQCYPHLAKDKNWRYSEAAPVLNGLYLLTGFGARGLCTAPLAADILVADLTNTPYPVNEDMLFKLSANRFVMRDIIRGKPLETKTILTSTQNG